MLNHDRCAIVHGPALSTMRTVLADKSVDMVLTDPPYSQHVHANLGKERRNDGHQVRDALTFPPITEADIADLAVEFVRICKGWIIIFTDFYMSATWGAAIEAAGGSWIRTGQWVKTSPMPQMTGDRPACGAEDIVIAHAVGKSMVWNGGGHAAIWRGPRDRGEHPNQKPAWLIQALLGSFAPPGGLVLDPFLGSGTTAFAALQNQRIAGEVVVETSCKECAKKRAEEWQPPLPQNLRVLGVEIDSIWVEKAIARIRPLLHSLQAA